ncbi:MAG: DNA polymerase III subunit delta' [Gemmataceae bacterium]
MAWSTIRGHDAWVTAFARAAGRGRLAHAYLFAGPPGVGKRLFARQLAKTLLCEAPPDDDWDSCDACPACQLVDAGTHPDLFLVGRPEDKLELPIAVVQQLCADLALRPARGTRKIAVVDDADDFNDESANAFLKTLEEPPPGSLLILVGTSSDTQLATIRSRCQVIPFAPLPTSIVEDLLRTSGDIDSDDAARLARLSDGSPGLARELADANLWAFREHFFAELAKPKPDAPGLSREFHSLIEEAGKDSGAQRRRASLVLSLLLDGLREGLTRCVDGQATSDIDAVAKRLGEDGLMRRIERCLDAERHVERRVQLSLAIEGLVDSVAV